MTKDCKRLQKIAKDLQYTVTVWFCFEGFKNSSNRGRAISRAFRAPLVRCSYLLGSYLLRSSSTIFAQGLFRKLGQLFLRETQERC
jgi:hypothetical protein